MNSGNLSDFVANLKAERQLFQEFTELLQAEQETLLRGDIDRLASLAHLKSDKILILSQLEDSRNKFLSGLSYSPNQSGMEAWLQAQGGNPLDARSIWHELLELAKLAQHLNQSNGAIIEQKLRHNQQALAVLQAASKQSSLYGPNGQTLTSMQSGRPLGKI